MLRATLTFVKRQVPLTVAAALAELEDDDVDFLMRHVAKLREEAAAESSLLTRFHQGSGVPDLLKKLLDASPEEFVEVSAGLARRLQGSMDQATNPSVGVLGILATGEGERADAASVLKLDAISEAASYRFVGGQVRLSVLRDLLPAPGQLQKGLSWPDPRDGSDATVIDRNITAAKYFFNAYELQVSATSTQAERALSHAILEHVPAPKRAAAIKLASTLSGPAETVVTEVQKQYPELLIEKSELGAGEALGGFIRQTKVAGHRTRYMGDGIVVLVPWDRLGQVSGPRQAGGGWEMTIRFSGRPQEDTS
jgi:hypothetical protein